MIYTNQLLHTRILAIVMFFTALSLISMSSREVIADEKKMVAVESAIRPAPALEGEGIMYQGEVKVGQAIRGWWDKVRGKHGEGGRGPDKSVVNPGGGLSGTWLGEGNSMYVAKQGGDTVIWLGQGSCKGKYFVHKGRGTISGLTIQGEWRDLPESELFPNEGYLTGQIVDNGRRIKWKNDSPTKKAQASNSTFCEESWVREADQNRPPDKIIEPAVQDETTRLTQTSYQVVVVPGSTSAKPEAQIIKVVQEHSVVQDGIKGMRIDVDYRTRHLKGAPLDLSAFFMRKEGGWLEDLNGQYGSASKKVALWQRFSPATDEEEDKIQFFLPYDELHITKPGTHALQFIVGLRDERESAVSRLDKDGPHDFTYTVPEKPKASVEIIKIWQDHEVDLKGAKGMKVHTHWKANHLKGKALELNIFFRWKDGEWLKDFNQQYHSQSGLVAISDNADPKYVNAEWKDFNLSLPYDELHITDPGVHRLEFRVSVVDRNNPETVFVTSDFQPFTYTVPDGPSAEIVKVWLEHNVKNRGALGMWIHVEWTIKNHKGRKANVSSFVAYEDGAWLRDFNGSYRSSDGIVALGENTVPPYDDTRYDDFKMFLPYDELHLSGEGRIYMKLHARALNMEKAPSDLLDTSDWVHFYYDMPTREEREAAERDRIRREQQSQQVMGEIFNFIGQMAAQEIIEEMTEDRSSSSSSSSPSSSSSSQSSGYSY